MDQLIEKLRERSGSLKLLQFNGQSPKESSTSTVKIFKASEARGVLDALVKRWRRQGTTGPASKRVRMNGRASFRHYHEGEWTQPRDTDVQDCAVDDDDRDDQDDQGAETVHVPTEVTSSNIVFVFLFV